jgi:hypothetical protein
MSMEISFESVDGLRIDRNVIAVGAQTGRRGDN